MTTGTTAQHRALQRPPPGPVVSRRPRVEPAQVAARPPKSAPRFADEDDGDELRLNLSDLPRLDTGLHVDGFAPTVTSRILDLIDRLRKR
jgi:hypothetical protein